MCGRFAFYSPSEASAALFGVDGALAVEPRYNIAPTHKKHPYQHAECSASKKTCGYWPRLTI
jgi:putative SOS response-associated peptidase YedK